MDILSILAEAPQVLSAWRPMSEVLYVTLASTAIGCCLMNRILSNLTLTYTGEGHLGKPSTCCSQVGQLAIVFSAIEVECSWY